MIRYLVQNKSGQYLSLHYNHLVFWGSMESADLYHNSEDAIQAGQYAFDCEDDAESKFDLVLVEVTIQGVGS